MERRPERLCWGWQAALLGASILSACFLLTQGEEGIPITLKPSKQTEGQDVTLTPGGSPNFLVCSWYREAIAEITHIFTYVPPPNTRQQNYSSFTGRETGGPGCTLHIRNLLLNDTGYYIVMKNVRNGNASEMGIAYVDVLGYRGYNTAALIGIVIGSLAGTALTGLLIFYCHYRYAQRASLLPSGSAENRPTVSQPLLPGEASTQ